MTEYVAFDLEISKQLEPNVIDILAHRPLGISCAATITSESLSSDDVTLLWYSHSTADEIHDPQMSVDDCKKLADYLCNTQCPIVGWNSLGFDLLVLADECKSAEYTVKLAKLAYVHIDPYFQMVCEKGYGIGLETAAQGMHLKGKLKEVGGANAPAVWAEGRDSQDKVLEYVAQDARVTASVYQAILDSGVLRWISRSGRPQVWPANFRDTGGDDMRMLTVGEAMELPRPDTSWMTNPRFREDYAAWMLDVLDTAPAGGEEPPPEWLDLPEQAEMEL